MKKGTQLGAAVGAMPIATREDNPAAAPVRVAGRVNLRAMRPIRLGGSRRLSLSMEVFNVSNVNTATTVRDVSSATYGATSAILPPRIARIGAELTF